jgi:hypothetical protein
MKWHADIQSVNNGFVVDYFNGEGKRKVVYQEKENSDLVEYEIDKSHIVDMFYDILDHFGVSGSRYDKKRISIKLVKGDKCES